MKANTSAAREYFPELDGVRALAILMVMSVHMRDPALKSLDGSKGVDIFFVLSGYLITTICLRETARNGSLRLSSFYIRRFMRIIPLYGTALAMYAILSANDGWLMAKVGLHFSREHWRLLPLRYYLSFTQDVPFFRHIMFAFYQSWSLAVEEKFYLVWPLFAFISWRHSRRARLVCTTASWILLAVLPTLRLGPVGEYIYPYFHVLAGCLLALLNFDALWSPKLTHLVGKCWSAPMWCGIWLVMQFWGPLRFTTNYFVETGFRALLNPIYTVVVTLMIGSLVTTDGTIQRFARWPVWLQIGRLSYGMYLIHVLAINVAEKVFRPRPGSLAVGIGAYLTATVLSIAGAYMLAISIERPCIALGKKWSQRFSPSFLRAQQCVSSLLQAQPIPQD